MELIWLAGLLWLAGCCGGDDGPAPQEVPIYNDTPYHVHVNVGGESLLFIPPGDSATIVVRDHTSDVQAIFSPGQGVSARATGQSPCCLQPNDGDGYLRCGSISLVGQEGLSAQVSDGGCEQDEGSCPYVYGGAQSAERLFGEVLTGALNASARREDTLPMPGLEPADGVYEVRIAAELRERDHIEFVTLELVEHPAEHRIVATPSGQLHAARDAVTAKGTPEVARVGDGVSWTGVDPFSAGGPPPAELRSALELAFERPEGARHALLIVEGSNTQALQDAYHAYMSQFGPGFGGAMRLVSHVPGYRSTIDGLMNDAGFSLGVDVGVGEDRRSTTLPAIGPAATRSMVVPLAFEGEGDTVDVRLSMLPGAWSVDAVSLATDAGPLTRGVELRRTDARLVGPAGERSVGWRLAIGQTIALEHGESLTLRFAGPEHPPKAGFVRTPVLRVGGYYELLGQGKKPCVRWSRLLREVRGTNGFARFARARLTAHAARLDRPLEPAP